MSKNFWSENDEKVYQNFLNKLGKSKHNSLVKFIRDPKSNPLYGNEDKYFCLYPDCADLPYMIRAYVAYKLRLPFSYVSEIASGKGDERYSYGNFPKDFKDQDYFSTPQELFYKVALVNSGYFRMDVKRNDSDFYPVKIEKNAIKPGTVYYDPNGHVAIVYEVTDDGHIKMVDAHPDKSISKPWFGAKFSRGNKKTGGGFKKWRPIRYLPSGKTSRSSNYNIPDYSATSQFAKSFTYKGQSNISYYSYIRKVLAKKDEKIDPIKEFVFMMQDLFEDIKYRSVAVDICLKNRIHLKKHPGVLPKNIYGTYGVWEKYSTPSRDARLKVSFRNFYLKTIKLVRLVEKNDCSILYSKNSKALANELLKTYLNLSSELKICYTNSLGNRVPLTFDDIYKRLFKISFDPYHSPELRWGASGKELESASDSVLKKRMYLMESRLRNQLERVYDKPTPFSFGPKAPIDVDIKKWLLKYIADEKSCPNCQVMAQNKVKEKSLISLIKGNCDGTTRNLKNLLVETKVQQASRKAVVVKQININKADLFDSLSNLYKRVYLCATNFDKAIPVAD